MIESQQQASDPVACFKCGHAKHDGECVNVAPQTHQIPKGYKLVPIEPTDEMIEAGCALYDSSLRQRYKAMLEAAPQPTAENQK